MKPFNKWTAKEIDMAQRPGTAEHGMVLRELDRRREAEGSFDDEPMTPEERRAGLLVFGLPLALIVIAAIVWGIAS